MSAGDLPPATAPPTTTTTTPRAPPRNVGTNGANAAAAAGSLGAAATGTAECPPERRERERSLLPLLYGVKSLWKGNKSLTSFERKESITSPAKQAFSQAQHLHQLKPSRQLQGGRRDRWGTAAFLLSLLEGMVLISAEPC